MNFKKNILLAGAIFQIVPVTLIVSCNDIKKPYKNDEQYKFLKKHKFNKRNEEFNIDSLSPRNKGSFYNAKIVKWIDGDTPTVDFYDNNWDLTTNRERIKLNIRISNIDTPELHFKDEKTGKYLKTTGEEFKLASQAKNFGDKEIPQGAKIKIYTTFQKSFNRVVGSIFYKKNSKSKKYKSYSVEIIKNGLAFPFVDSAKFSNNDFTKDKSNSILDYIGYPLADAYNYAVREKLGVFADGAQDVLKKHGATDTSFLDWREGEMGIWDSKNIYDRMQVNKEEV